MAAHFSQPQANAVSEPCTAAQHWELPPRVIDAITEYRNLASPAASPLGKALVVADQLAMAQLLGEHDRIAQDLDLGLAWPEWFAPASVVRCQHDLRRHFPTREGG